MYDLLDDIRSYLSGCNIVPPSVIFLDSMPDQDDLCVSISEYSGGPIVSQVEGVLRSVQIEVRSKEIALARSLAWTIHQTFRTEDSIVNLTSDRWAQVALRQTPFKSRVDSKNRVYFTFNMGINTYFD